jgi:hypothetical protein
MSRSDKITLGVVAVLVIDLALSLWWLYGPRQCPACLQPAGRRHMCDWSKAP